MGLNFPVFGGMQSAAALAELATSYSGSRFQSDIEQSQALLDASVTGRRVLVIGGAGSIGSAVVELLVAINPAVLHVIDQSENNLAELVRSLRSSQDVSESTDLRTLPLDYGGSIMGMFLASQEPYDLVMNFAALKHVRSEKDSYSLLQMLETNILKQARFMKFLAAQGFSGRYFCVSTDKAANPVSLMGASKRLMEHVLFATDDFSGLRTSARFANVAFSDGSLLHSWLQRVAKRQPIAVPRAVRRYFVSMKEAGHICLLAAIGAPNQSILVPRLDPSKDLVELRVVAERLVRKLGLEPAFYESEKDVREAVDRELPRGRYPVLLTPSDTSGEKPFEVFVGDGETLSRSKLQTLDIVSYCPAPHGSIARLLRQLELWLSRDEAAEKADVIDAIGSVVPQFHHVETGRNLDQRI
jgi:FlaA1/EpsC-like NDP-sugar epimerase